MIFREATMADADLILSWRNDPDVFANFRVPEPVGLEEHLSWFAKTLSNPERHVIIIAEESEALGMIRLDERDAGNYEVAIIIAPSHQGKGYGSKLLRFVCTCEDGALIADIKKENAASRRLFEKCEFRQISREAEYVLYRRDRK